MIRTLPLLLLLLLSLFTPRLSAAACNVGNCDRMGGLDISAPRGWNMRTLGPSDVLFENISGPVWSGYTRQAPAEAAVVSVDVDTFDVSYVQGKVKGGGLFFCTQQGPNPCDTFYAVLLTSDKRATLYTYDHGQWGGGIGAGFQSNRRRINLRILRNPEHQDQFHIVVNGDDIANTSGYRMPQSVGILVALEPGDRVEMANFNLKERD
jgi:hypothetical protein